MGCNASKEAKDEKGEAPYSPSKEGGEEVMVKKSAAGVQSAAPPKPGRSPAGGENGHVRSGGQLSPDSPDGRKPGDYNSLERSATLKRDKERARLEFFGIDPDTKKRSSPPDQSFTILDQKLGITPDTSPHRLYSPSTEKDGYVKGAAVQIDHRVSQVEPDETEFAPASPPTYIGEREKGGTGNVKDKIQYMEDVKEGKANPNLRLSKSPSPRLSFNNQSDLEINGDINMSVEVHNKEETSTNQTAEFGKGLLEGVHKEDVLLIKEREQGKLKQDEKTEEGQEGTSIHFTT